MEVDGGSENAQVFETRDGFCYKEIDGGHRSFGSTGPKTTVLTGCILFGGEDKRIQNQNC